MYMGRNKRLTNAEGMIYVTAYHVNNKARALRVANHKQDN